MSAIHISFQSTLLMRGATRCPFCGHKLDKISIHAPHARSDVHHLRKISSRGISIHAPHARSDWKELTAIPQYSISIHAPHARSDQCGLPCQSPRFYFNPRSSCEERPGSQAACTTLVRISIHAPHARSDSQIDSIWKSSFQFQSTLLMRGATAYQNKNVNS